MEVFVRRVKNSHSVYLSSENLAFRRKASFYRKTMKLKEVLVGDRLENCELGLHKLDDIEH